MNVFIFHGTEGYPGENWFPWMKKELEARGCRVVVPQFPSPPVVPAKMDEWRAVLKGFEKFIDENTIFIGHSLGGLFLLRVLEKLSHPIRGACFVGTPVGVLPVINYTRDTSFSGYDFDWEALKKKARHFIVYHSDNDPYVSLGNGEKLAEKLGVRLSFVPQAGHFNTKAGYTTFEALRDEVVKIL